MVEAESYLVSLSQLSSITAIRPANKHVFVIENQMVFSEISSQCPNASLICTSGQVKIASLAVLDMLCKEDCIIHYSGDTDPEGIGIAERLILRSRQKIQPWRMSKEDYLHSLSSVSLSESRLKECETIQNPVLKKTAECIKEYKKAGYQEKLMKQMIADIRNGEYL